MKILNNDLLEIILNPIVIWRVVLKRISAFENFFYDDVIFFLSGVTLHLLGDLSRLKSVQ